MNLSRLCRLYQPRNPLFWLMLVLNGLSPLLAWVVQNRPLNTVAMLVVTCFAIGNAVLGMWLVWRLLYDEPVVVQDKAQAAPASGNDSDRVNRP